MPRQPDLLPSLFQASGITEAVVAGPGVWHAPCPRCGGEDRVFLVDRSKKDGIPFAQCRYYKQSCDFVWWLGKDGKGYEPVSKEEKARIAAERARRAAERDAQIKSALERWQEARTWERCWKTAESRSYWLDMGIPNDWIDFWKLGFDAQKVYSYEDKTHTSPAHTIPKFALGSKGCVNMDWRLTSPVDAAVNRYRPVAGLPAACWVSRPDYEQVTNEVFIFEGAKKAMVSFMFFLTNTRTAPLFIGHPSMNSWAGADRLAARADRAWIIPDPDAIQHGWPDAMASAIGKHARIVEFPEKIDDLIVDYGLKWEQWASFFRGNREARSRT